MKKRIQLGCLLLISLNLALPLHAEINWFNQNTPQAMPDLDDVPEPNNNDAPIGEGIAILSLLTASYTFYKKR